MPTLIVVEGPPGSGKTSLAHEIARALPCPAVCRDEIKEGMALGAAGFTPAPGDPLTVRTLEVFFEVLRVLLSAGVSVVAEAAFQDSVWRPRLEDLASLAELRIVHCSVEPSVGLDRIKERAGSRAAHADTDLLRELEGGGRSPGAFERRMAVPSIDVDTTDGYRPVLEVIVGFLGRA